MEMENGRGEAIDVETHGCTYMQDILCGMQDVCGVFIKRLQTWVLSVRHCYFQLAAAAGG